MVTEMEQKKNGKDCSSVTQGHLNWQDLRNKQGSQDIPEIQIWEDGDEGTKWRENSGLMSIKNDSLIYGNEDFQAGMPSRKCCKIGIQQSGEMGLGKISDVNQVR